MTIIRRRDFATRSLDFPDTASKEFVTVADNSVLNPTTTMSLSAWMSIDDFTGETFRPVVAKFKASGGITTEKQYIMELVGADGKIGFFVENSGTFGGEITGLIKETWVHIVGVYDGGGVGDAARLKIFKDRVAETVTFTLPGVPATIATTTEPLRMGAGSAALKVFDGRICQCSLFNIALDQAGIDALADANGKPADLSGQTGLVWWNQLGGLQDTISTINDDSANSNNGTVTSFSIAGFSRDAP